MILTKNLAIWLHRKLWNWIADETRRKKRKVDKDEYPLFKIFHITSYCWCCEYARRKNKIVRCKECPIDWGYRNAGETCIRNLYGKWRETDKADFIRASILAKMIAELPERGNNV